MAEQTCGAGPNGWPFTDTANRDSLPTLKAGNTSSPFEVQFVYTPRRVETCGAVRQVVELRTVELPPQANFAKSKKHLPGSSIAPPATLSVALHWARTSRAMEAQELGGMYRVVLGVLTMALM